MSKKIEVIDKKDKIIFRDNTVFYRHEMANWFERNNIKYITGISTNNRLVASAKPHIDKEKKQKLFG